MATKNITIDQLISEVRYLAAENPTYVYPRSTSKPGWTNGCFYRPGAPGNLTGARCIFGQALTNLGLSDAKLAEHDSDSIRGILSHHVSGVSFVQSEWCVYVQTEQDAGSTWAAAVRDADIAFPGIGGGGAS